MSNLDERLERIENQVEMLHERQRLSRFDNLMFLIYPLLILSMTLSLTLSLYEGAKSTVWGLPLDVVVLIIRVILLIGLGTTFLFFCFAYAMDSLGTRLASLENLISVLIPLALFFLSLLLDQWSGTATLVRVFGAFVALFILPLLSASFLLFFFERIRFLGWVASWFERSMPITLKETQVSLDTWHKRPRYHYRLIVKASWSLGFVMYFMMLMIAVWRGQLGGRGLFDTLCVAAFLIATEAIILWRL